MNKDDLEIELIRLFYDKKVEKIWYNGFSNSFKSECIKGKTKFELLDNHLEFLIDLLNDKGVVAFYFNKSIPNDPSYFKRPPSIIGSYIKNR